MAQRRGGTRLELTWPNKDRRLLSHGGERYEWVDASDWRVSEVRLLHETRIEGDGSPNLVIEGDALHALTALTTIPEYKATYEGKVKLCYIDPPFNTKQAFEHYDDSVEHSIWLTMLRDRLDQIHKLLRVDGSVWVHLDDVEQHRARSVLDEVFGPENFVSTVIWEKVTSARNDTGLMSTDQDYIIVYAKDATAFVPAKDPHTSASDKAYQNPDDDPRGAWREGDYKGPKTAEERPNLYYPLTHPRTGEEVWPRPERVWAYGPEEHQRHLDENLLWWGKTQNYRFPKLKTFLSDRNEEGTPPRSLWRADDVDTTRRAKDEVKNLFPGVVPFKTPKPERLLRRVLHIASDPGDIVLDCFAGSGTTAAVAHKMDRRWVTVELSPDNIDRFVVPRLTKVVRGEDPGGITTEIKEVFEGDVPDGMVPQRVRDGAGVLKDLFEHGTFDEIDGLDLKTVQKMASAMRRAGKVAKVNSTLWTGGGGFRCLAVGPSMFEDYEGNIVLADWATGGELANAVAAQLGYSLEQEGPFCGRKGRSRLAVVDGMLTHGVAAYLVERLDEGQTVLVVAQALEPGAADHLRTLRPGSRARKVPRDLARAGRRPGETVQLSQPEGRTDV